MDILILSNSIHMIADRSIFALVTMGLSYMLSLVILVTVCKSFYDMEKWLPRIPYLIQLIIIKQYCINMEPANP